MKRVLRFRVKSALVATDAPYPRVLGGAVTHVLTVTKDDDQYGEPLMKWQLVAMVDGMYVGGETPWEFHVRYEIQSLQRNYDTGLVWWNTVHTFDDHDRALACLENLQICINGEL